MLPEDIRVALRFLVLFVVISVGAHFFEYFAEVLVGIRYWVKLKMHFVDYKGRKIGGLIRVVPTFFAETVDQL